MNNRLSMFALILILIASAAQAAEHGASTSSVGAVKAAIGALGHKVTEYQDVQQEPHLVFSSKVRGADNVAVFFDDCDYTGYCEDVTFYADFGEQKISDRRLNAWNHIGSKNRTKAFRNSDGSVGVSYTMTYVATEDASANGMLAGLFLLEAEIFGVMLEMEE